MQRIHSISQSVIEECLARGRQAATATQYGSVGVRGRRSTEPGRLLPRGRGVARHNGHCRVPVTDQDAATPVDKCVALNHSLSKGRATAEALSMNSGRFAKVAVNAAAIRGLYGVMRAGRGRMLGPAMRLFRRLRRPARNSPIASSSAKYAFASHPHIKKFTTHTSRRLHACLHFKQRIS